VKIYNNIKDFKKVPHAIVTIGTFDGVHLGHQAIFKKMKEAADAEGGETVVITFHPHPRLVLQIDSSNLRFINTQARKIELLEEAGIDNLVIIQFTKAFSRISSESFIREYIVDKIAPARLVIGYDHHFGKNRMGDFRRLYDLGHKLGFKVDRIAAQDVENIAVSSTKIRKALEAGDVKKANLLLGYPYSITGKVIRGNELGRTIGFPTANIQVENKFKLITNPGVYASFAEWRGKLYQGMGNIGYRPTIQPGELTIEVHIFDFDEDLYDQEITIRFIDRIRDEQKFDSITDLRQQLMHDQETALNILKDALS
jgi:riboflavin kinase / FMN adenylyltransferase